MSRMKNETIKNIASLETLAAVHTHTHFMFTELD